MTGLRERRTRIGAILLTVLVAAAWGMRARAGTFAELLADAGVDDQALAELASVSDSPDPLAPEALATARNVLRRLRQFSPEALQTKLREQPQDAGPTPSPGDLTPIAGRIVALRALSDSPSQPAEADDAIHAPPLWLATVDAGDSQSPWTLLLGRVPSAWAGRTISAAAPEPIEATAVVLRGANGAGQGGVALAAATQWFPTANVPAGWQWLASRGFDMALLDEVRHRARFVKPSVSREGEAFRSCLQVLRDATAAEVERLARDDVQRLVDDKSAVAAVLGDSESDSPKRRDQTRQIVAAVEQAAAEGRSSVAPMFLRPEATTGRFVLIEGIARRAVQVLATGDAGGESRVSHYELDVFTGDSQDMPVACCATRLPEGFPLGDAIRQPVRVGGVFFKLWTYGQRPDDEGEAGRTTAPVVIVAEPTWLRGQGESPSRWLPIVGGGAFLTLLAALWYILVRSHRRERRLHRA